MELPQIYGDYAYLDAYLRAKPGVELDYKPEWDMFRYRVKGKQFASFGGDREGRPIFTVKLEPAFSLFLREQYPSIVPGYYANKLHWSSMYLDGSVPKSLVLDMADDGYRRILAKLTRKDRESLQPAPPSNAPD